MKNEKIAQLGQELAEKFFTKAGWKVLRTYETENNLPYDLKVYHPKSRAWKKVQVKTTRRARRGKYVFRTRKSIERKKVPYDVGDFHFYVLVDASTSTVAVLPFSTKSSQSFSVEEWKISCKKVK